MNDPSRASTRRISKCPTPGVIIVIIVLSMSRQSRTSAPPGEHSSKDASPGISTVQGPSASAKVPRGTVRRGLFEVWTGCPQRIGAPPNLTHSMISWLTTLRFLGFIVPQTPPEMPHFYLRSRLRPHTPENLDETPFHKVQDDELTAVIWPREYRSFHRRWDQVPSRSRRRYCQ